MTYLLLKYSFHLSIIKSWLLKIIPLILLSSLAEKLKLSAIIKGETLYLATASPFLHGHEQAHDHYCKKKNLNPSCLKIVGILYYN